MNERLLQFIWQFRYYNAQQLHTTLHIPVEVIHPGEWNTHQGADFQNARINIDGTIWAGAVELHLHTSDWYKHGHQHDDRYAKIILHVVYEHDVPDWPTEVPVLELRHRISGMMLQQYSSWMSSQQAIPCGTQAAAVPSLIWQNWLDRLLVERLQEKTNRVAKHIQQTQQHWEEVCWRMISRAMGGAVNGESFEQMASYISVNILAKHKNQIHQLEALLLGQAGLLHKHMTDKYAQMLYKEYQFLQQKYQLRVIQQPPSFLRMRPVNFPTIRLAQLAMLIHRSSHLFSQLLEANELKKIHQLFDVTANDYWQTHFKPDQESEAQPKTLGKQAIDSVVINAIAPLLYAYGKALQQPAQSEKALRFLQATAAEKNTFMAAFAAMNVPIENAYTSQALLQLRKQYCDARRCLECAVGNRLLRSEALSPTGS
jgi:hypothetical protein